MQEMLHGPLIPLLNTNVSLEENGALVDVDVNSVHVVPLVSLNLRMKMTSRTFSSNEVRVVL